MQNVYEEFGMTKHDAKLPFFKHAFANDKFSYCVFASETIIGFIKTIPDGDRRYLMDATFKVVPFSVFTQLLVIHIEYLDKASII